MFYIKGIDKPAFMSRVKAVLGIKKDVPTSSQIFIESRKFLRELEEQLEGHQKKEKVLDQVYKFINRKRDEYFFCLQEYQKEYGWNDTVCLLAVPMKADKVLKEMVDQKDNELKELKTKSILEEHDPTDKEVKEAERESREASENN